MNNRKRIQQPYWQDLISGVYGDMFGLNAPLADRHQVETIVLLLLDQMTLVDPEYGVSHHDHHWNRLGGVQ